MSIQVTRMGLVIGPRIQDNGSVNINGPCCIEIPSWCRDRLARFYLYYASHSGKEIKFAYADSVKGPWVLADGGVLGLDGFRDAYDHIASPDISIDSESKEIRLYFHARSRSRGREQWTFAAISNDGRHFRPAADEPLAPFYLKTFKWSGFYYGMSKGGNLWRSKDGLSPFEKGGNPFDDRLAEELWHNEPGSIRHVGLSVDGTSLMVFYTRIGDKPERIYMARISDLAEDWKTWKAKEEVEVLRPEEEYEGSLIEMKMSIAGPAVRPENGLRDPHILECNGRMYMFYAVAGEQGIAVCRIKE